MSQKVVIVGGVAGGASAAARLRRLDESIEIVLFERDQYISFANCGLPYYIGEVIQNRHNLLLQTPESMMERFRIDVRVNSEVTGVDPQSKKVTVKSKDRGIYEETYDHLILSPGAKAIRPNIPGIENERIFSLRNVPDTDRIKAHVDQSSIQSAIVIGGGFIGVEMAENLRERGLAVTLVEAAPHILAPFDSDMVLFAEQELQDKGVHLILNNGVERFAEQGDQVEVILKDQMRLQADLVILAIGVTPDTGFLRESGLAFGPKGHILVNEYFETNLPDIYAIGDAIEVVDFVTKQKTAIPLAGPANKQGRIVADNIAGKRRAYQGTQGTSILKVFDLTAASTGANERTLTRLGIPYRTVTLHPASHATYYPGAMPMHLKLIFGEDGKVLGAQAIGVDGVDKRIDVIATVLRLGGTVADLAELELAYAPPFSSAKDPVNMAGFVAQNALEGIAHMITWEEVKQMNPEEYILLDVRTQLEYENGHIPGAINIPVDELRDRLQELDPKKLVVEYCKVGHRAHVADRILSQHGFQVKNVTGGYTTISMIEAQGREHSGGKGMPKELPLQRGEKQESIRAARLDTNARVQAAREDSMKTLEKGDLEQGKAEKVDLEVNACGLCCPGPLMQVKKAMDTLSPGQVLQIKASDPGFYKDIQAWCKRTGNNLVDLKQDQGIIQATIRKGDRGVIEETVDDAILCQGNQRENKTMVVFSGDLDKAIASFIIANGAASMGRKVTMFFTFWGLNILRKPEKVAVKKGLIDRMFGIMMPRGSKKLKLSKMNMLGMGGKMIRRVMKDKHISSLEELIQSAMEQGVEIVACQMSMDVMGIRPEELIDGVKIGGVGYYLGEAEESNVNLFI